MADHSKLRRRLLLNTAAWAGGIGLLATARPAGAFQVYEESPKSDLGLAYSGRCGPASEHAGLIAQLQSRLASDPSASSMTTTCPLCGCPVTVSR
jgi:hypothetical protein